MAKERLRKDYLQKNFVFAITPRAGKMPDIVFTAAKKRQELWNTLVAEYEVFQEQLETRKKNLPEDEGELRNILTHEIRTLAAELRELSVNFLATDTKTKEKYDPTAEARLSLVKESAALSKLAVNLHYRLLDKQLYNLTKSKGEELELSCWLKWETLEDLKKTLAAKKTPKKHFRLEKINLPHRTESGGIDAGWLFEQKTKRKRPINFRLLPAMREDREQQQLGQGYMTVLGEDVRLSGVFHRNFPKNAILKRISLCGRLTRPFGWQWHLVCGIEFPPEEENYIHNFERSGALDLGWRVRPEEEALRIGMIFDGKKYHELLLPFDLANRLKRKHLEYLKSAGKTPETTADIRDTWKLQSKQDQNLEKCKSDLREFLTERKTDLPEEIALMLNGWHLLRRKGLHKIYHYFNENQMVPEFLEAWRTRDFELTKRIRRTQLDVYATRNQAYRQIAVWIAREFPNLIWEGDLSLKTLAEKPNKDRRRRDGERETNAEGTLETPRSLTTEERVAELAGKYRAYASLSILRAYIKDAYQKYHGQLINEPASGTSSECEICGAAFESSLKVMQVCENSHVRDQDKNSSRLLFRVLPDELTMPCAIPTEINLEQIKRFVRLDV